jgi:hypothetical protein
VSYSISFTIVRATLATATILREFVERPRELLCGTDLMRMTGLGPGTMYPALTRLEAHGLIEEVARPATAGPQDGYVRYWYRLASRDQAAAVVAKRFPELHIRIAPA